MIDLLWLKAVLKTLVLPPTGLLLIAALGLALGKEFARLGRALAAVGVVGLLALSMPIVADFLIRFVDTSVALDLDKASTAQAIVILGGGVRRDAPEYGGDTLATLTLERVRYGARVARLTGLPVLVSGGSVLGGEPEAQLMAAALGHEFGVPVRWVEANSRTTHDNAVLSARMLKEEGIDRIVLVIHGFDTRRATAEFEAQGLAVVTAATGVRGKSDHSLLDYLPGMGGLQRSYFATYEILANLVRVVHLNR